MPKDHYVAETYLKHFVGADGFFYVCRKSDGKTFPSVPKSICHEWDGDFIPDFLEHPEYLRDYRKIFEPGWNLALENIEGGHCSDDTKLAIAGYWGNLLVCTPTWRRVGVSIYNKSALDFLKATSNAKNKAGKPDQVLNDGIAAIEAGKFTFETDPNYVRAVSASHILKHALQLYNADWVIVRNLSNTNFLTSDNPAALKDPGPFKSSNLGLLRYLPITPKLCIICEPMQRDVAEGNLDMSAPPKGKVRWATVELPGVENINNSVVQCAEDLVISSEKLASVEELTKKFSGYQVVSDFMQIPSPNGDLHISYTRVRDSSAQKRPAS